MVFFGRLRGGTLCRAIQSVLLVLIAAAVLVRIFAPESTRPPDIATRDQFVVITDNPFLMPSLPERRKNELLRSVRMNLDSPYVSALHMLNQAPNTTLYPSEKLHVYDLGSRSTILDAIRYANAALAPGTMFVIANADVVFVHDSVRLISRIRDANVVAALSRHDANEGGNAMLHEDPHLSQDAWFMRTPFPEHPGFDFPLGALGSDNKLAYLFGELNMTVVNWCNDVIIWHFHASQHRKDKARLPQPYAKVPNTRVNISVLETSWRLQPLTLKSRLLGPLLQSITLDLPRLAASPALTSDLKSRVNRPSYTSKAIAQIYALARRRCDQGCRLASMYFLDLPWQVVAQDSQFSLNGIREADVGTRDTDVLFALALEEAVPWLCRRRRGEWREVLFGVVDANGSFKGEMVCPPHQSV